MSLESIIDNLIKEAIGRGEFDNLKGKGKPLDLTAYFNMPEDLRMAYTVLESNHIVPEEVDLIREIADLKRQIREENDKTEKRALSNKLNDKTLALNLALARYKRRR